MREETPYNRAYYGTDFRKARKVKDKELLKFAPRFRQLAYGKKYILPHYRQADYYPQDVSNVMYSGMVLETVFDSGPPDDVVNAAFANALMAMKCQRPQLWLEKELGFKFGDLPLDFETNDVKFRWPGMRIHLPKGLLQIRPKGPQSTLRDLMYLDICMVPARTSLGISRDYVAEIEALVDEYGWDCIPDEVRTKPFDRSALIVSGNLNGDDGDIYETGYDAIKEGALMCYGVIKPFDDLTLREIAKVTSEDAHLSSPLKATPEDDILCEKMLNIALNTLLFLGSMPLEYDPTKATMLRKPRLEGKHPVPGLYAAQFVGRSQLRPHTPGAHLASPGTGQSPAAHWKKGHWQRVVYGKGRTERRLQWIYPYPIGELRAEYEEEKKKALEKKK